MANKKITLDGLEEAVKSALTEYEQDVKADVAAAVTTVSKLGAQALKTETNAKFNPKTHLKHGRYGTGWSYQITQGRLNTTGVIYNKKYPGIPHLQENGHAKRGGGRTEPIVHIEPIETKVQALAVTEVMKRI